MIDLLWHVLWIGKTRGVKGKDILLLLLSLMGYFNNAFDGLFYVYFIEFCDEPYHVSFTLDNNDNY